MDLLAEARLAALAGKMRADDPAVLDVRQMMRMLTTSTVPRARARSVAGSIEVGKRADLVVFDANRLEATPNHDMASNLIYSMNGRMARDVLVDGEIVVRNGKLTRMDESALVRDHRHRGTTKGRRAKMKIGAVMFFTTDSMRPAPLAKELEERGFESLWVPEHTHIPPRARRTTRRAAG